MLKILYGGTFVALTLACVGGGPVRVVEFGGDGSCSTLFNYCFTVRCSLENTDDDPQTVEITYIVNQDDGRGDRFVESVSLGAGERRTYSHDFKSVGLIAGQARARCRVE